MENATAARFQQQLRDQVVIHLRLYGYSLNPKADVEEVVTTYLNLAKRLVPARPRAVQWSGELRARKLAPDIRATIVRLQADSEAGADLNPYLHQGLRQKPAFADMLLNDWGIHHFHLGSPAGRRRVSGSAELLFAIIRESELLLLDVLPHRCFSDPGLFEVAHRNFPHALAHARIDDDVEAEPIGITIEDRAAWRKLGATIATVTADGTGYWPAGGGYMQSGLSKDVRMVTNKILNHSLVLAEQADHFSRGFAAAFPVLDLRLQANFEGFYLRTLSLRDHISGATF